MPYLTQLAKVARRTGYPVTEVPGWRKRGHGPQPQVRGVVVHHTAGATAGGDYPSMGVVRDGRTGLPGPLSHFGLGRSGRIYVIAAGRCYHNAPSTSPDHTNSASIGIEAENNGRQPWPREQLDAYHKLCAELCREFDLPVSRVKGHKEVNTGKPDPHSINMNTFRSDVERALTQEEQMPTHERYKGNPHLIVPPGEWRYLPFTTRNGAKLDEVHYSLIFKPAFYVATAAIRFANATDETADQAGTYFPLQAGEEVQLRAVEVTKRGGSWEQAETGPINSPVQAAGGGHFTHTWNGNNQDGHRLRFQITHFGERPALLDLTDASVMTWPY